VVRTAVTFGAVGFVFLQVAEIVLPAFLPGFEADAALRVMVVAFLLLCPVVVALAWVYEMTPRGIEVMDALDADAGRPPPARALPRIALLVFTMSFAGSAGLWWYRTDTAAVEEAQARRAQRQADFMSVALVDRSEPIRSLAVLPFDDFSVVPSADMDAFVAGMHEALILQLSLLGTVGVVSRASTEAYSRQGKSLAGIASDLGVDGIVESSVLRADGRVRITMYLVDASTDRVVWGREYDRGLEDVIALQREVGSEAASEIGALLDAASRGSAGPTVAASVDSGQEFSEGADHSGVPAVKASLDRPTLRLRSPMVGRAAVDEADAEAAAVAASNMEVLLND
jgi:TolB-like protein